MDKETLDKANSLHAMIKNNNDFFKKFGNFIGHIEARIQEDETYNCGVGEIRLIFGDYGINIDADLLLDALRQIYTDLEVNNERLIAEFKSL